MAELEIEVMYADKGAGGLYRRRKVSIEGVETLPREGALAIVVSYDGTLVGRAWGRRARELPVGVAYGTDFFAFVRTAENAWFIDCWDEDEVSHSARSMEDPCNTAVIVPAAPRRHRGERAVCFRGVYLPTEDWHEALRQVDQFMVASP